jgi:hypothetical protein
MHLPGYPVYYVKDGKRRAVYYTAEARDLKAMGWKLEEAPKAPEAKPTPKPEVIKPEVVIEDAAELGELPDFEFMTRTELLKYAMDRGVDLPNNALKAELVEACKKLEK